jgi:integrase
MPRPSKPYVFRGWYCTNYGGVAKQKLCKVEEGLRAAELALARLKVQRADAEQEGKLGVPGTGVRADLPPVLPTQTQAEETFGLGLGGPKAKLVGEVFDEFLNVKEVDTDELTYIWYRDKLTPFYLRFRERPLRSVTLQDGLDYKLRLMKEKEWMKGKVKKKGLGNVSVNHHIRAAKTLFNWAAKPSRRYIDFNPWAEISYLAEKPRERVITDEEFKHLLEKCADGNISGGAREFREQLIVLRHTTMRPGELRLLRWDYIQWSKHKIVFPATETKTKTRRPVTMLDVVEEVLAGRKARLEASGRRAEGYVFPAVGKDERGKHAAVDADRHIECDTFSKRFARLFNRCVKLGLIEKSKAGEKLVLYSTRHTRITELVAADVPMKAVMDDAGHKVPSTTNRYTHLADDFVSDVIRQRAGRPTGETSEGGG